MSIDIEFVADFKENTWVVIGTGLGINGGGAEEAARGCAFD